MVVVENIKSFFKTSEVIALHEKYVTIDGLNDNYDNVSIQLTGMTPTLDTDVLGNNYIDAWSIRFNVYIYSNVEGQREIVKNNELVQDLSLWIADKNIKKELPILLDGYTTENIAPSSIGLFEKYENGNCTYLIQCVAQLTII